MTVMRFGRALIAAALLVFIGLPAAAQNQDTNDDLVALKAQLLQLKVNPYPPPRERSAQILVAIVRRMDVTTIDKATIDEIAGFLQDDSDTVRGRMAIALGNIGPAAQYTVPALQKAFGRDALRSAHVRNAVVALAMERFRVANAGNLPETLSALVPAYLKELPVDPYDGKPVRYKRREKGYIVYCVGPDEKDDGGVERPAKAKETDPWDVTFIVERPENR